MFLDAIKTRYQALGYASTRGCTPAEIQQLAHQLTHPLPAAYAEFLAWAGHDAGDLFLDTEEYAHADIPEFQRAARDTITASGMAYEIEGTWQLVKWHDKPPDCISNACVSVRCGQLRGVTSAGRVCTGGQGFNCRGG